MISNLIRHHAKTVTNNKEKEAKSNVKIIKPNSNLLELV